MQVVNRLMYDLTTLMIAYRLSTLTDCDLLPRLENGTLAELTSEVATAIKHLSCCGRLHQIPVDA